MSRAVGIDLGTTYTLVAVLEDGRPRVLPNVEGQPLTPSVVAFCAQGMTLVGQAAKTQAAANPLRTVASIKRHMGSDHKVRLDGREYTPQEISALILRKVKVDAESYLGGAVDKVVITVPAYFNDRQRQATKEAGMLAGLEVVKLLNEPTAAALAYGLERTELHRVLVWDLGGGTFDVSILELDRGIFEVRAVGGDTWLGGDDFDLCLMDYLEKQYRQIHGVDFPSSGVDRQRLREAAEQAKIDLSQRESTIVYLPFLDQSTDKYSPLKATLTREQFQRLSQSLLERMVAPTRQALADAQLEPEDIDRVILVGGATRMPAVRELAIQLLGKEPYTRLNPDETVALGAAIQAGMLLGEMDRAVLLDVLPLSLGVESQGGLFTPLIPRNSPLPTSASRLFTTATDDQTSVDIHVLQGERALAVDNMSLGRFQLEDIPPLKRGAAKFEVTFTVDDDGILHVAATDLINERAESLKLGSPPRLTPGEVQRRLREAETNAAADKKRQEQIEANIVAQNLIAAAEMFAQELLACQAYIEAEEIQRTVHAVKEALAGGQTDQIHDHTNRLKAAIEAIHQARQATQSTYPT